VYSFSCCKFLSTIFSLFVSAIYYLCCVCHLLLFLILCQLFHLYVNHFVFYQPFNVVSAISYCVSPFTYFVSHSMFRAAILYYVSHFRVVPTISCFASHFNVLSVFDFVAAILSFCQIFYIYCQSFFGDIFFVVVCVTGLLPRQFVK
jgi:hypothetical protein